MSGDRKTVANASAMCASSPKPAVGAAKSIESAAGVKNKFTNAERRTAAQTLRSHARSNAATPSPEWQKKAEWARTVFPNYGLEKPQQEGAQAKRQRSIELPGPSAKRSKIQPSVSFAEITKDRVLLGLRDRGNPENRIPRNKWKAVESKLSLMVREKPGSSPCCMDAGWYQGSVKVVACDNQRSADLYKQAVAQLGAVYEGANIVALDWCDVPSRPRARIWVPAAIVSPEDILHMLQECNPHLPTKDWKVVKVEEHAAVQVLAEEVEAPGMPEDGYSTDSSLSREMRAMGPAIDEVDLSDSEADVTVVEVAAGNVAKTPADQPTSQ
ncbi:uncharacterized protein [Drosophila takahashii]|uniref:uncharacterized protein n=1 Tax=Drosophila takahashii TaxID=29030 RepID=UPI00389930EB